VIPPFGVYKERSVGLPLPQTIVEVTALDDPMRVLLPGATGEICIRGPQVMVGYWRRPEETATTMAGGRLHTGDIGHMDEEGYIYITDRAKDLILVGGYNVYPRVVEDAILRPPAVADVAVCGIPDDYRGETVKAFIVTRPDHTLTMGDLKAFLRDKLAPFDAALQSPSAHAAADADQQDLAQGPHRRGNGKGGLCDRARSLSLSLQRGIEMTPSMHHAETRARPNCFEDDVNLQRLLRRTAAPLSERCSPRLATFGAWVASEVDGAATYTDRFAPPILEVGDRDGELHHRLLCNPRYEAVHRQVYEQGIVGLNHSPSAEPFLLTFAMGYL
jgi:hypothetical protein